MMNLVSNPTVQLWGGSGMTAAGISGLGLAAAFMTKLALIVTASLSGAVLLAGLLLLTARFWGTSRGEADPQRLMMLNEAYEAMDELSTNSRLIVSQSRLQELLQAGEGFFTDILSSAHALRRRQNLMTSPPLIELPEPVEHVLLLESDCVRSQSLVDALQMARRLLQDPNVPAEERQQLEISLYTARAVLHNVNRQLMNEPSMDVESLRQLFPTELVNVTNHVITEALSRRLGGIPPSQDNLSA